MSQMSQMKQNPGMAQMFGGQPGSAEAMAQMAAPTPPKSPTHFAKEKRMKIAKVVHKRIATLPLKGAG